MDAEGDEIPDAAPGLLVKVAGLGEANGQRCPSPEVFEYPRYDRIGMSGRRNLVLGA
jgi:hypothetical protein